MYELYSGEGAVTGFQSNLKNPFIWQDNEWLVFPSQSPVHFWSVPLSCVWRLQGVIWRQPPAMRASLEKFQFDLVSMENEHCRMGNLSPACGKRTPPSRSQTFKIYQLLVTSSELSFAADSWMNSSCLCILCSTSMAFPASVYPSSTTVDFIFLFFFSFCIQKDFWTSKHIGHMKEPKNIILVLLCKYFYVQEI